VTELCSTTYLLYVVRDVGVGADKEDVLWLQVRVRQVIVV